MDMQNSPYFSYLCHYGVKGQKKGQRRYQNEDGSYTNLGREHYGIGDPRLPGRNDPNANNGRSSNSPFSRESIASRFKNGASIAYNNAKSKIKKNYKELRDGDAEKGKQLADEGATKTRLIAKALIKNSAAAIISDYASTMVAGPNGKSLLSKAVRGAGTAFILKNTLDTAKDIRNLSKYKETQKKDEQTKKETQEQLKEGNKHRDKDKRIKSVPETASNKDKYANKKMSSKKAIDTAYADLEKIHPNFDKLPLKKQDELFFNYLNETGLYKWV